MALPRIVPAGIATGVFVCVEGVNEKTLPYRGVPHRVVAFVVGTVRGVDEETGNEILTVTLRGVAFLPRDGMPRFSGRFHWH